MVKRLKLKLILICMCAALAVVFSIFIFTCIFSYNSQKEQTINFLEEIVLEKEQSYRPNKLPLLRPADILLRPSTTDYISISSVPTVCVYLDEENNILSTDGGISKSSKLLKNTVNYVLEQESQNGRIDESDLIYIRRQTEFGSIIAFTSAAQMDASVKTAALVSLILCSISLVIFFIIFERIAEAVVQPIRKAQESQCQFISQASDKLSSPVSVILTSADIVLESKEDTVLQQEKWLASIQSEAMGLKKLISQMQELAESENTGKAELAKEDISQLTYKEILCLEAVAYEKQILFNTQIEKSVVLKTDKNAFSRIIQILLNNAIKYSRPLDKISVLLKEDKKRAYVFVTNPSYISEEALPHIFDKFNCGDNPQNSGNGIDLAIAKGIAGSIRGSLSAESSVLDGTTFMLMIKK